MPLLPFPQFMSIIDVPALVYSGQIGFLCHSVQCLEASPTEGSPRAPGLSLLEHLCHRDRCDMYFAVQTWPLSGVKGSALPSAGRTTAISRGVWEPSERSSLSLRWSRAQQSGGRDPMPVEPRKQWGTQLEQTPLELRRTLKEPWVALGQD